MYKVFKVFASDAFLSFVIFMGLKAVLTIAAHRNKYLMPDTFSGDTSQDVVILQNGIVDGMELAINAANPISFISINVMPAGIGWDRSAFLIALFSLVVAVGFYKIRKMNECPDYGY
ncbi:MAG: hypothetical protein K8R11_00520 [Methanococcoides sp.]|nr:hypothetical protein [Methanococcoides sp.]